MLRAVEVHSTAIGVPKLVLQLLGYDGFGPFHIRNIDGLGPVKSTLNSRPYGLLDGEYYTGGQVGKRNIVMTLGLNQGAGYLSVEATRRMLYGYLLPKMNVILKFVTEGRPLVQIEGFVESCEPNLFSKDPEIQVSILCPKPHFESVDVKTVTGVASINPLETPFVYNGDIQNGFVLNLVKGAQDYTGPIIIEHGTVAALTRRFETLSTVNSERYYSVNSRQGLKTVKSLSVGTNLGVVNLLKTMTDDSLWLNVFGGANKVRVKINSDVGMPWTLSYVERFGGL